MSENCQRCGSPRLVALLGEQATMSFNKMGKIDHVVEGFGIGTAGPGSTGIFLTYCTDCGQIQGAFPATGSTPWGSMELFDRESELKLEMNLDYNWPRFIPAKYAQGIEAWLDENGGPGSEVVCMLHEAEVQFPTAQRAQEFYDWLGLYISAHNLAAGGKLSISVTLRGNKVTMV